MPFSSDSTQIPKARVVKIEGGASPSLRARVGDALAPVHAKLRLATAIIYGFWPLVAAVGLLIALAWGAAMGQSP